MRCLFGTTKWSPEERECLYEVAIPDVTVVVLENRNHFYSRFKADWKKRM